MKNYTIIADSAADIPEEYAKKYNIDVLGLKCNIDGEEYTEDITNTLSYKEFYKRLKNGSQPTTSQVAVSDYYNCFEKNVKEDISVIYPAFSAALSGSYNAAVLAKNNILEKYPNADITIIDTKCVSFGCGLLIVKLLEKIATDKTLAKEDAIKYIEDTAPKMHHIILLDDLFHLKRGGRLSGSAATLGSILKLKPLIKANEKGELINYDKIKGRKKGIRRMFSEFEETATNINEQEVIGIAHSDCEEDAKILAEMITDKYNVKVIIGYLGLVIGSHAGPGALCLYFVGQNR